VVSNGNNGQRQSQYGHGLRCYFITQGSLVLAPLRPRFLRNRCWIIDVGEEMYVEVNYLFAQIDAADFVINVKFLMKRNQVFDEEFCLNLILRDYLNPSASCHEC
jgi:hypothetical protein